MIDVEQIGSLNGLCFFGDIEYIGGLYVLYFVIIDVKNIINLCVNYIFVNLIVYIGNLYVFNIIDDFVIKIIYFKIVYIVISVLEYIKGYIVCNFSVVFKVSFYVRQDRYLSQLVVVFVYFFIGFCSDCRWRW